MDDNYLRDSIRRYVADVLEVDEDEVKAYSDDKLWGEVLSFTLWLCSNLASNMRRVKELEETLPSSRPDRETSDGGDAGYDDLDCEADE